MRKSCFSLSLLLLLLSSVLHAQQSRVTLRIVNQKKEPVPFATIELTNRLDSTAKVQTLTVDSNGKASLQLMRSQYMARISAVNYGSIEKGFIVNQNEQQFSFTIEQAGKTMEAAVVRAQRPLMRQEDDKTIIEPENLAAASTSGYEVIEKTPGLFIDQDGNIYISSLTPAAVQINGRDMKMSASDIATILKSLPPTAIAKIEIIRSPSARYDASGGGGMVNVVLKKGVKIGMTGSVYTGYQQGVYGTRFAGMNINNNDGRKTSFVNLNISERNSYERIRTDRLFAPDSVLKQDAYTRYPSMVYYAGAGIDVELNNQWSVAYSGCVSLNDFNNTTRNPTQIWKISTNQLLSDLSNNIRNDGYSLNLRNGVNLKRKIDSLGSQWENDVFHNYSLNEADQQYESFATANPSNVFSSGDGNNRNRRNQLAYRSDLILKLKKKLTVEAGIKTTWLWFNSRSNYFRSSSGQRAKDPNRTNSFDYRENINALYVQGSKTVIKDLVVKIGVRAENTRMNGHQLIPSDTSFKIDRTDLFPYVYISKNIMKIFGFDLRAYLIYRRTISRPVYEQLNPFPRYVDQFLSEAGNPTLRPQFTRNYEANISVDERPILAVGVNETTDIFTNVIYQSDTSSQSQAVRTYDNLGRNKEWYLRALGAIPPGGKFFIVVGAQYNHNFYQGLYENKPLSFKKGTWTYFFYQTLKFAKLSQFTMNGFIRLKGQQQFYELSSFGSLNASVNRQFFKQKLIVTLSMSDIFKTNRNDFQMNQGTVSASGYRQGDTRRFGINLRYNFGIRKKEENNTEFNTEPSN